MDANKVSSASQLAGEKKPHRKPQARYSNTHHQPKKARNQKHVHYSNEDTDKSPQSWDEEKNESKPPEEEKGIFGKLLQKIGRFFGITKATKGNNLEPEKNARKSTLKGGEGSMKGSLKGSLKSSRTMKHVIPKVPKDLGRRDTITNESDSDSHLVLKGIKPPVTAPFHRAPTTATNNTTKTPTSATFGKAPNKISVMPSEVKSKKIRAPFNLAKAAVVPVGVTRRPPPPPPVTHPAPPPPVVHPPPPVIHPPPTVTPPPPPPATPHPPPPVIHKPPPVIHKPPPVVHSPPPVVHSPPTVIHPPPPFANHGKRLSQISTSSHRSTKSHSSGKKPFRLRHRRVKATHKKSIDAEQDLNDEDTEIEDIRPEMKLLEDVDEGKVQEGFTAESFQREKIRFASRILNCTAPIRSAMKLFGRFPFKSTRNEDGTVTYEASLYRPQGMYFIVVSLLVIYFLIIGSFNLMDVMLNLTFGDGRGRPEECEDERMYETALIDRNIVGFTGVWTALCHATLTSVNMFFKRNYMAQYLSFWTVAAQTMHVDMASGIFKYSLSVVIFYILVMGTLTVLSVYRLTATAAGMPSLFAVLMFRLYYPCILSRNTYIEKASQKSFQFSRIHYVLEVVSGAFLVIIYILSKILIIYFLHFCRMLVTALKSWNARFHAVMTYPDKFAQSVEGRTTYDLLFNDHCTLLSLIEGTDRCFSTVAESYIALQLINIIMETYLVYRNVTLRFGKLQYTHRQDVNGTNPYANEPFYSRPYDVVPGLIILLSNVIILVVILKEAGRVSEVAKEGLEVIRRKTMMGRRSDQELWFTLSMYFSYSSKSPLSLKGSGFFEFDNAFIITVLAVIFSHLISVIQFSPVLDADYRDARYTYQNYTSNDLRENIATFIRDMEERPDRYWVEDLELE